MTTPTNRWHDVHPSEYPHEQQALELLRQHLPDSSPFRAWSNFEFIAEDGSINEVDALVVSSDRIYLVEIKHWAGHISGNQNSWLVRSPSIRLPTWSWFCENTTNCLPGFLSALLPKVLFLCVEYIPS